MKRHVSDGAPGRPARARSATRRCRRRGRSPGTGGRAAAEPRLERPKRRRPGAHYAATGAATTARARLGVPPREVAARLSSALAEALGSALDRDRGRWTWLSEPVPRGRLVPGRARVGRRRRGRSTGAGARLARSGSSSSSYPRIRPARWWRRAGATPRTAMRWRGSSPTTATRSPASTTSTTQAGRFVGSACRCRRVRGEEVPEDGYQGEYIADVAREIPDAASLDVDAVAARAVELLLAQIKATLERFGVRFDVFFSERVLHEGSPSPIERVLSDLEAAGQAYRSEGALWLRTSAYGDNGGSRRRALERRADLLRRRSRVHARQARPRLRSPARPGRRRPSRVGEQRQGGDGSTGGDPDTIEVLLIQFVHLAEGGERAAMSKRRGEFVTLDELLDEIGVDVCRYFMLAALARPHAGSRSVARAPADAREPRLLHPVRARADRVDAAEVVAGAGRCGGVGGGGWGSGEAAPVRAGARDEACRVSGRGRRGGRPASAAQDRGVRARARPGLHRVLPRLPRRRRDAGGDRVVPDRAVGGRVSGRSRWRSGCSA